MTTTPERRTATFSELVADKIYVLLKGHRRMSQAQLARVMGQSQMWVSDRLRGIQPIGLDDLQRFAEALGVEVHDLLPTREEAVGAAMPAQKGNRVLKEPSRSARRTAKSARHEVAPVSPIGQGRTDSSRPEQAVGLSRRRPQLVRRDDRRPRSA